MNYLHKRLTDPQLVVSFQKFCGVNSSVWENKGNKHECTGVDSNMAEKINKKSENESRFHTLNGMNGVKLNGELGNSDVRERLVHKNGVNKSLSNGIKNGLVQNGHHNHTNGQVRDSEVEKTNSSDATTPKGGEKVANAKVAMMAELLNDTLGEELRTDSEVDFRIKNKFLFYLFNIGANLGNEAFYILFFPTLIWNMDGWVGRRMVVFWCLYMYIGQATKDILKIPRPPSPPVVRIERRYALEYGMPSTHAMTGLGMPFTILYLVYGRYEFPFMFGFCIAALWCVIVSLSRLYLGMHTILDILAGLLYTAAMMPLYYFWVMEAIDTMTLTSTLAPFYLVLVPLVWCLTYPKLDHWSTARGDTTLVLGTGVGLELGMWWSKRAGIMHAGPAASAMPLAITAPTLASFTIATVRIAIGSSILILTRLVVKTIVFEVSCWLSGIDRKDPKAKEQLPVELPCKYITYIAIAFTCVVFCPVLFEYFGIQRQGFYYEL